jgi:4-hydroxy-3-methylbut-2-en-1-yl diphosphate reductase
VSDLLVAAPLSVEALAIRSVRPSFRVRTTGMGPHRARAAVGGLSADPALALAVLGFGGGLASGSKLCDVVVAHEVVELDEHGRPRAERIACHGSVALAQLLSQSGLSAQVGMVASVREIVTGGARERMLASGAVAVDMESAWVAQAARGRPFAVVRVLSDTPERELRRRLPVGPPLPTMADAVRVTVALRRVARALDEMVRASRLHTVLGMNTSHASGGM